MILIIICQDYTSLPSTACTCGFGLLLYSLGSRHGGSAGEHWPVLEFYPESHPLPTTEHTTVTHIQEPVAVSQQIPRKPRKQLLSNMTSSVCVCMAVIHTSTDTSGGRAFVCVCVCVCLFRDSRCRRRPPVSPQTGGKALSWRWTCKSMTPAERQTERERQKSENRWAV